MSGSDPDDPFATPPVWVVAPKRVEVWRPAGPGGPVEERVGTDPDKLDLWLAWRPRNDLGNADRLIARFGRELAWCAERGWLVWTASGDGGGVWRVDPEGVQARRLAHRTAIGIGDEAKALKEAAAEDDVVKGLRSHCSKSCAASRVTAMLGEARPYLEVEADRLDRDPALFGVANGVLVLDREADGDPVRFREARREDWLTRASPARYDPQAPAPGWRAFLTQVQPDEDVRGFLQRWCGYCLSGFTGAQLVSLWHGTGANGKTQAAIALSLVLGSCATTLNFESLQASHLKTGGGPTPDLVDLVGCRLAVAEEPEGGATLSEGMLKRQTGGAPMKVRQLNRPFFEFVPTHKLLMIANEAPRVKAQDEGTWRRLAMVPWRVVIPPEARREELGRHLAETEGPGLLNWLLDGWRLWVERGMDPPAVVREASAEYRADQDPLGDFLGTAVSFGDAAATVRGGALFKAYETWAVLNGATAVNATVFGRRLRARGLRKGRRGGFVVYEGAELTSAGGDLARGQAPAEPLGSRTDQDSSGGFWPGPDGAGGAGWPPGP